MKNTDSALDQVEIIKTGDGRYDVAMNGKLIGRVLRMHPTRWWADGPDGSRVARYATSRRDAIEYLMTAAGFPTR